MQERNSSHAHEKRSLLQNAKLRARDAVCPDARTAKKDSKAKQNHCVSEMRLLLLGAEHGGTNVGAGEADVGSLLDLLDKVHAWPVGTGTLESSDVGDIDRGLGGEILLGHGGALGVLEQLAGLLEGLGDIIGHLLGCDNVFAAVDLGQVLAFDTLAGCLCRVLAELE
jgi:hypothetical protein